MLKLIPIKETIEENSEVAGNPGCESVIQMTVAYCKKIGFNPPWIGYFAQLDDDVVGSAGFKGKPVNNRIEIAYGTMEEFKNKGIGTAICRELVLLAMAEDPTVIISARTLTEQNFSTKILQKNGFKLFASVWDEEDGEVWEWRYEK